MEINIVNIIESTVTLIIFYAFYYRFLRKETFHKINRIYLISTLIFAVTVPFFSFNIDSFSASSAMQTSLMDKMFDLKNGYIQLNEVVIYASSSKMSWPAIREILIMIYTFGIGLSALFFVVGLIRIITMISLGDKVKYGRYRIVETKSSVVPFSLFKWIIINPEKYSSSDIKQVIAHEKMHSFQLHSVDLILVEVLVILFWFNPFIYWYRKSIREIHEYLADEAVLKVGFDKIDYQQLLFKQASGNRFIGLTSSFSYSLSKNRLKMLTMMKSNNLSKLKVALAIPFAAAFFFFFTNSCDFMNVSDDNPEEEVVKITKEEDYTITEKNEKSSGEEVHFVVDEMPKFQGKTSDNFRYFIQQNLKYPEEAQKNNIQGRVFVQFDVDKEGNVQNAKVIRGVAPSLDEEALRVVRISPKWEAGEQKGEPVRVRFTFPITFKLS